MKKFQARVALPGEEQNYFDWLKAASDINLVDTKVYEYPTCNTITVDMDTEPVLMNSVHLVMMMEALAPKPGVEPKDEARALRELYRAIRCLAANTGVREIWFTCIDETLHKFIERKGFERVHTPVFRMKVGGATDPFNERRPEGYKEPISEPSTGEAS